MFIASVSGLVSLRELEAHYESTRHPCYMSSLCAYVLLIELPDPNLGLGASGTQESDGAVVPKGTNKRRAV